MKALTRQLSGVLALTMATLVGCKDGSSPSSSASPFAGLARSTLPDSVMTPPPVTAPGYFQGSVRTAGTPPDTIATAPRIANVRVTAYRCVLASCGSTDGVHPDVGAAVASTTTDANGEFVIPVPVSGDFAASTLPGGAYAVSFVPPDGSPYQGVWVWSFASNDSGRFPWLVMLVKQ